MLLIHKITEVRSIVSKYARCELIKSMHNRQEDNLFSL